MRFKCNGCGESIGTGCGCCSPDLIVVTPCSCQKESANPKSGKHTVTPEMVEAGKQMSISCYDAKISYSFQGAINVSHIEDHFIRDLVLAVVSGKISMEEAIYRAMENAEKA